MVITAWIDAETGAEGGEVSYPRALCVELGRDPGLPSSQTSGSRQPSRLLPCSSLSF